MKKILILTYSIFCLTAIYAQSLNVKMGEINYVHQASNAGNMTFSNGQNITIEGKTYNISAIDKMEINNNSIDNNTVNVTYNGNAAEITVAGNIAKYLTISANGSDISISQDTNVADEITYILEGSSSNGSFVMNGDYKATLSLNNLSLTNTKGSAIDIENGKRINVILTGTNTLSDNANGSHNACFYVDGHPEFSGTGSLTVSGNTKHGISSGDYTLVESGTINVKSALGDGFHVDQYFKMNGGNVTIQAIGDGIDCGFKGVNKGTKDTYENNGFILINDGTINITTTGDASKGIKCDSSVVISGGNINITTSGAAYFDTAENDLTSSSAIKCDGSFTMSAGNINLLSTGSGGKGLNATEDIKISGGTLSAVTTGNRYKYDSETDTKSQGIKTDKNIILSGGNVYAAVVDKKSTTFKTDFDFKVDGATIMAIGGKEVEPTGAQRYKTYSNVAVSGGQTISYNGVSFTVPSSYSNTSAAILVSSPSM